jgi:aminobenzoyl-glutamate utilization protein B
MEKSELFALVDDLESDIGNWSQDIWTFAEPAMTERRSADFLATVLENHGFDVTMGIGALSTAFVASYGTGSPTIGLLGEYDALPADAARKVRFHDWDWSLAAEKFAESS